jgi:hypothetical protein
VNVEFLNELEVADLDDENVRTITINGTGRTWATRWERLATALGTFEC